MNAHPYSTLRSIKQRFNLPDPLTHFEDFVIGVLDNTVNGGVRKPFCTYPNDMTGKLLLIFYFDKFLKNSQKIK